VSVTEFGLAKDVMQVDDNVSRVESYNQVLREIGD
jgi:hypothetical protein